MVLIIPKAFLAVSQLPHTCWLLVILFSVLVDHNQATPFPWSPLNEHIPMCPHSHPHQKTGSYVLPLPCLPTPPTAPGTSTSMKAGETTCPSPLLLIQSTESLAIAGLLTSRRLPNGPTTTLPPSIPVHALDFQKLFQKIP